MTHPNRRRKLSRTCTVTRAPATGETGVTAVAAALPCTNPFPASRETRSRPELAHIYELWEIVATYVAAENNDTLTLDDGQVFSIVKANPWLPATTKTGNLTHFVLETSNV